jgi:Putative DNA-binding domain
MHDAICPPYLDALQQWFAKMITTPLEECDADHIPIFSAELIAQIRQTIAPSPHLKSEERLGSYKQQYWWRLIDLCQKTFPSLVRLVGCEEFDRLFAQPYLLDHPPQDWFLPNLWLYLPDWLEKRNQAPFVSELARLDLAYDQLFFKETAPPLQLDAIDESTELFLQPCVQLFVSSGDLFAFRLALLKDAAPAWENSGPSEPRYFVLYGKKEHQEVSEPLYALLYRFKDGARLSELASLLEKIPQLLESFQMMAEKGWLRVSL